MNQDQINRDLREKESSDSPLQKHLLNLSTNYMRASSNAMQSYWDTWDNNEIVYRAYRVPDKEDHKRKSENKTGKLIVPVTYAQTQTFISFLLSAYTQREYFYELRGVSAEDQRVKAGLERDLQYQLNKQNFQILLYNNLLDACQYGFQVNKIQWTKEEEQVRAKRSVEQPPSFMQRMAAAVSGQAAPTITVEEEIVGKVISYEGNKITCVSPYNFYPDPNFPLAEFQKGEFVADEEEVSLIRLKEQEGKLYHGTDKIPDTIPYDVFHDTRRKRRVGASHATDLGGTLPTSVSLKGNAILTEICFYLIPAKLSKEFNIDLGKEKDPVQFVVTVANDLKIIRFERCGYLSGKFPYAIGEYSPNHNAFLNPGLNDMINDLQTLETWMINSHVKNVQNFIKSRFIADPTKINIEDITSNSTVIRTAKPGDISNAIKQLSVGDITRNHITEVSYIQSLIQLVTGINENALGQYASGRRSATEAHNVNAGAAARLQMHAKLFYESAYNPMGALLIANTRQGRSKEVYESILGEDITRYPFEQTIMTPLNRIMGGYDFVPFDALLPSQKLEHATVLKEIFSMLVSNPQTIQLLNKNPLPILEHIVELLGIYNLKDFNLNAPPVMPTPQVVPDQVAGEQVAQGAQPVDLTGLSALQQLAQE